MTPQPFPGLTATEVAERTRQGQVNRVRRSDAAEYRDIVFRNLFTLFNALVVPAAVALFLLEEYQGAFAVSGMAFINSVIGLVQELRAKRHLDKLALLAEARARVVRDGQEQDVPAGDVVLGDVILLSTGESVVADGEVLEARFLEIDEALLTGESDPVPHKAGDQLLSGSFCVAGEGVYRADKVGKGAFAHSTAAEARAYRYTASPLQHAINRVVQILTATAVFLCLCYVVLWAVRESDLDDRDERLVKRIAATITSMVPQGLVLTATIAFTLGAIHMSRRGAVVQRLSAVESMAAVDVLCMDKTGTLTTNRLKLVRLVSLRPDLPDEEVRRRVRLFASTSIDRTNKNLQALRAALGEATAELLDQIPFKSQNRYSAVRVKAENGEQTLAMGACEAIGPRLQGPHADGWEKAWKELRTTGLRLLLFAESPSREPFNGTLDGVPLEPLALIALSDEIRAEAGGVLAMLASQGIAFKIISGDNAETVRATVAHLDLPLAKEPVVSGDELASAPNREELIANRGVFGRVSPKQKVEIVATLQGQGRRVAMIGDGVNDVLPIKKADLGIAMGEGSGAARTVAGLVLENNNFELLPETLEEGRTLLRNIRRSSKLFLLKNVYTFILIVGFFFLGVAFPYQPQQVTLLNFLTIGIPALVITFSRERSRAATKMNFLREVGSFVFRGGIVIGVAGLVILKWAALRWPGKENEELHLTLLLSTLILLGVTALLRVLTDGESQPLIGDTRFRFMAVAAIPVYLGVMYWGPTASFFRLAPLGLAEWGMVLAVAVPAYLLCLATDYWIGRMRLREGTTT